MCGIIGVIGRQDVAPQLLDTLQRLEHRSYDSAGVATSVNGHIEHRCAEGKLANLRALLGRESLAGDTGIGHTRRATHGRPSERDRLGKHAEAVIELPTADPFVTPILAVLPVQRLAYHAAVSKGTGVDRPRNLAKSVTVE